MSNYLFIYRGGTTPDSPEEGARVMQAWTDWLGGLGEAVIDPGNPVSQVRIVAANGSVSDGGGNPCTGYSVIKADSLDAAVAIAKGCPGLQSNTSVEVAETFAGM